MKVNERNLADPGSKNAPFPAWVLRYANQQQVLPSENRIGLTADLAEEQNYSELSHFEETQAPGPSGSEPVVDLPSAE